MPATHGDATALYAMTGVVVGEFITAQAELGYIIMFASSAGETVAHHNRWILPIDTIQTLAA